MASTIMHEVWQHAAQYDLTPIDLLVLLRLADSAGADDRMGWESSATIAARIGAGERSVFRSLATLERKGIITTPPKEEWPLAALRYRSVVRHIRHPEQWSTGGEKPSDVGQVSTVVDVISTAKSGSCHDNLAPNSNYKSLTTNSDSLLDTSYLESTLAVGARRTQPKSGWDLVPTPSPKRMTKRQQREAAAAAEGSTDAFEVLGLDEDHPDLGIDSSNSEDGRLAGRAQVASRRSTRALGPSENLARYFETAATPQAPEEPAGRFVRKPLSQNIAKWRREGTTDAQIRSMIETYWGGAFRRNLAVPAWKDFINQRAQIHAQTHRAGTAVEWEANRHNEDFWV